MACGFGGDAQRRNLALKSALVLCLALSLSLSLSLLIGMLWQHPRPFMLGLGHSFVSHSAETSFPSDHLTVFASTGLSFLLADGLAVAWARIFLGVRFPLDMLGAVLVSGIACHGVTLFWARAGNRIIATALTLYRKLFSRAIQAGWVRS